MLDGLNKAIEVIDQQIATKRKDFATDHEKVLEIVDAQIAELEWTKAQLETLANKEMEDMAKAMGGEEDTCSTV